MGAGIAYVSAHSGMEVVLIDQTKQDAEKGFATITRLLEEGLKEERFTPEKRLYSRKHNGNRRL